MTIAAPEVIWDEMSKQERINYRRAQYREQRRLAVKANEPTIVKFIRWLKGE